MNDPLSPTVICPSPFQGDQPWITHQAATGRRMYANDSPSAPPIPGLSPPPYPDAGNREAHFDDYSNFHQLQLGGGTQ